MADALKKGNKVYRIVHDSEGRMLATEEAGVVVRDQVDGGAWADVEVSFNGVNEICYRIELRAEGEVL